jgi:hypothetical protein
MMHEFSVTVVFNLDIFHTELPSNLYISVLQVYKAGEIAFHVDGKNKKNSNWMRFVNCAKAEDKQNGN